MLGHFAERALEVAPGPSGIPNAVETDPPDLGQQARPLVMLQGELRFGLGQAEHRLPRLAAHVHAAESPDRSPVVRLESKGLQIAFDRAVGVVAALFEDAALPHHQIGL